MRFPYLLWMILPVILMKTSSFCLKFVSVLFIWKGEVNYERKDNTTCALPCYYQILSNNFSRREEEMTFQILNISAKTVLVLIVSGNIGLCC